MSDESSDVRRHSVAKGMCRSNAAVACSWFLSSLCIDNRVISDVWHVASANV